MARVAKVTMLIESDEEDEELIRFICNRMKVNAVVKIDQTYNDWTAAGGFSF